MCSRSLNKPTSLPRNWPNPTPSDLQLKPLRIIHLGGLFNGIKNSQEYQFCSNFIKTSKYEIWSFLPLFLLEEFNPSTKLANCYFLIIAGMQCVQLISNTRGYPTVLLPLLLVLFISGLFKCFEDIERHKADTQANSSLTLKYNFNTEKFEEIKCSEICVGDFVKIFSRESIPADLLLVKSSDEKGLSYVETKSLDGETNLKQKYVLFSLIGKFNNDTDVTTLKGRLEIEHPNNLIDDFSGVIYFTNPSSGTDPTTANISQSNVILRGCSLRSTEWIVGVVLNSGHDVKIMQSKLKVASKTSNLESLATNKIYGIILLLLVMCFTGATAQLIFDDKEDIASFWYLEWPNTSLFSIWILKFFYMLLLHATFIPVSLYVSMALVRSLQSYFMIRDLEMYYPIIDSPAVVRTMTLNEELGQVSQIFSDKTGTLTSNNMNFRKASINGVPYGQGITEIGKVAWKLLGKEVPEEALFAEEQAKLNSVPHVAFYCPDYDRDVGISDSEDYTYSSIQLNSHPSCFNVSSPNRLPTDGIIKQNSQKYQQGEMLTKSGQKKNISQFYRFLSICHEVVMERIDGGKTRMSPSNPDDEALVCAAAYFGFEFKDRIDKHIIIYDKENGATLRIQILYTIPFSSTRKRMSVIIRDIDNKIKIICKGADSLLLGRVAINFDIGMVKKTALDIETFSVEGLRCLVVAMNILDEDFFSQWKTKYDEACVSMEQLESKKNGLRNDIEELENMIEADFQILGATAIEDKLQEGVPECVDQLLRAGIKIWMLTGDKEATAINIAIACNLVEPPSNMEHIIINSTTAPTLRDINKLLHKQKKRDTRATSQQSTQQSFKFSFDSDKDDIDYNFLQRNYFRVKSNRLEEDISVKPDEVVKKDSVIIVDGPSLILIMGNPKSKKLFLQTSLTCQSVVCCRVSPDQKREVLDLVKNGVPGVRTLAIGDGANDVAMIKAAHVGIGIKGEEGVQAVNASDFAIAQFRYLKPLLLKHGRYNYIRMSRLICFMFYKNVFMSSTLFWYSFYNAFSETKYYTEGAIQLFNVIYTFFPIVLYGAYDRDILPESVYKYPQLYIDCIRNTYLNHSVFWMWVFNGFLESALVTCLPLIFLEMSGSKCGDGLASYLLPGLATFTSVVLSVNCKIYLFQRNVYIFTLFGTIFSIGLWVLLAFVISSIKILDHDFFGIFIDASTTSSFYLTILIIVIIIFVKDLFLLALSRFVYYCPVQIIQEMEDSIDSSNTNLRKDQSIKNIIISSFSVISTKQPLTIHNSNRINNNCNNIVVNNDHHENQEENSKSQKPFSIYSNSSEKLSINKSI